jgi:hypothetical protein
MNALLVLTLVVRGQERTFHRGGGAEVQSVPFVVVVVVVVVAAATVPPVFLSLFFYVFFVVLSGIAFSSDMTLCASCVALVVPVVGVGIRPMGRVQQSTRWRRQRLVVVSFCFLLLLLQWWRWLWLSCRSLSLLRRSLVLPLVELVQQ